MRGKRRAGGTTHRCRRIIPAHAGQTTCTWATTPSHADHPRACGANMDAGHSVALKSGSSPRMRGKPRPARRSHRWRRIIPAHAGQTRAGKTAGVRSTDHPRACGANCVSSQMNAATCGSSPRMRGKLFRPNYGDGILRIIPAHAGQTVHRGMLSVVPSDHPRACGANRYAFTLHCLARGSSPRMRGKLLDDVELSAHLRIIPAHAGQTRSPPARSSSATDHPRACGANSIQRRAIHSQRGSSPRMRGKLPPQTNEDAQVRIIPAHAGQTSLTQL